ncbi:hypothetical protein H6784_02810 [Candidatus Nomurabacteria bacterium]|nr:hypothetical protein [Candidatus Kaiserbacteria bacterium]MCB9814327.1 hypothetical protein [Candidatus Nomurabacteria bacterium]
MEENNLKRNFLSLVGVLILLNLAFFYYQITNLNSKANLVETEIVYDEVKAEPVAVRPEEQVVKKQLEALSTNNQTQSPTEEDVGKQLEILSKSTPPKPVTEAEVKAQLDLLTKP